MYSVTIYGLDGERSPQTTVFETEEAANAFMDAAKSLIAKRPDCELLVKRDSGEVDSAYYLTTLAADLCLDEADMKQAMDIFRGVVKEDPQPETNKYYVTYRIDGRYEVEACVPKDVVYPGAQATEKSKQAFASRVNEAAVNKYLEANFGELTDIVLSAPVIIEDDKGEILWEA